MNLEEAVEKVNSLRIIIENLEGDKKAHIQIIEMHQKTDEEQQAYIKDLANSLFKTNADNTKLEADNGTLEIKLNRMFDLHIRVCDTLHNLSLKDK